MKNPIRALALAALCLTVPAASGEAPPSTEPTAPEIAAAPSPAQPAPEAEAAVVLDPTADAKPLGFIPGGGIGGGDDQLGTCTIYCDGQPRPYQMTYDECCGGPHLCPSGEFSEPNTYWSPNYGSPVLCTY